MGHHRNNHTPANTTNVESVARRIAELFFNPSTDDSSEKLIPVGGLVCHVDRAFGKKNGAAVFPQVVHALQQDGFMVA